MGTMCTMGVGTRWVASLGVALLLAATGCGSKGEHAGASVAALSAVDPSDDSAYAGWLAANEVERLAVEPEQGTRGVSRAAPGIWILYPRGDARQEAVGTYAIEVSPAGFAQGGVIELRRGVTVLHRDEAVFAPSTRFTYGRFPSPVTEAIKVGENLTWGVYYAEHAERNVVAPVRVVSKPAAERQLLRIESDTRNASQTALVKSLGRGQVLLNNSLFGEALSGYLAVANEDPLVVESWTRIGDCLRRMDMKSAPLFSDAQARASSTSGGNARNRARAGGGGLDGPDTASATRAGQPQAGQPGADRPSSPAGVPHAGTDGSAVRSALGALGDMASAHAVEAQSDSSAAQRALEAAQQALAAANAALAAADEAGRNRAEAEAQASARRVAEAQVAADQAAVREAQAQADQRMMAEWARIMGPGSTPPSAEERDTKLHAVAGWAGGLAQEAAAARTVAEELARQAGQAASEGRPDASELRDQAQAAGQEAAEKAQAAEAARAKLLELQAAMRDTTGR